MKEGKMDKSKIKLYYNYYIPITVLQAVSSILLMSILSVEDYGLFVLYQSTINIFFFLTLGIPNGYTLSVKKHELSVKNVRSLSESINCFYIIFAIITMPLVVILNVELYWKLAYASGIFNAIFIYQKAVLRTELKIHSLNILTILFRINFLLDVVIYILTNDIELTLIFDVVFRGILVILSRFLILYHFNNKMTCNLSERIHTLKHLSKIGMPIMLGNWLISIYTILDKTFLSESKELLGLYSFAITSVLLVRVILIPISELYFVTLDENESMQSYYQKINTIWYISIVLIIIAAVGAIICIQNLGLFAKYEEALPVLLILLNILPLSASLDVYIYNFSRRLNGKRFLMLSGVSAAITFGLLWIYTTTQKVDLNIYAFIVYFTYLIIYGMYLKQKLDKRKLFTILAKNIIFMVTYSFIILNFIK